MKRRKIVAVDLFCGAGGTSEGLAQACKKLKIKVDLLAVNHWAMAVRSHKKNHPWARHICQSIEKVDPIKAVPGRRVDLLVASPECRHHSVARGGRPIHDQKRPSAWHILRWVELLYVKNILIENVPEFRKWGPINSRGYRVLSKQGQTYKAFLSALSSLGYNIDEAILNSADYGDATTRKRLFIIARKRSGVIKWPKPSHAAQANGLPRWRAAKDIIDWTMPGESIFNRKRPLAPKTIDRIAEGLKKFAGPYADPFLIILRGTSKTRSVRKPIPSLTAGGGHVAVCEPFILSHRTFKNSAIDSINKPMRTLTTTARDWAIAQAFVITPGGPDLRGGRSAKKPLATVTCRDRMAVVQPFIVPNFGERRGQKKRTHSIDKPLPAPTSHGAGGIAIPFILPNEGVGRGNKSRSIGKPIPTTTSRGSGGVVLPYLVEVNHGKNDTKKGSVGRRAKSLEKPLGGVTTHNGWAFVAPMLVKYYGTGGAKHTAQPVDTLTAKDRMGLALPLTNGKYAIDILFRMLQPHELAAAMSFPREYAFCGTKSDRVKQIGNAVAVGCARALCTAILTA